MSDVLLFVIGLGISGVVGCAVGLLVWGASQERYVSSRHVGADLLKSAEHFVEAGGDAAAVQSSGRASAPRDRGATPAAA